MSITNYPLISGVGSASGAGSGIQVYPSFASFPGSGSSQTFYYDDGANDLYFWNGAAYEIAGNGPLTTDDLPEGGTNLYYTSARVDARIEEMLMQQYAILLDEVSTTVTYVGEAVPGSSLSGAVWRIKKLTEGGATELVITWASGTSSFDKIWNDRLTYTYS